MRKLLATNKEGGNVTYAPRRPLLLPTGLRSLMESPGTCRAGDRIRPQPPVTPGMSQLVAKLRVGEKPHIGTSGKARGMVTGAVALCLEIRAIRQTLELTVEAIATLAVLTDMRSVVRRAPHVHVTGTLAMPLPLAVIVTTTDLPLQPRCRLRRPAVCPELPMPCLKGFCLDNRQTCLGICAPRSSRVTSLIG